MFFGFIQDGTVAFDPGVGLKLFILFSNPDAQV